MKLLITGDLAIIHPYDFTTQLDKSVIDLFSKSDINIVNLEAPVTESKCKILKTGPHLKSHKQSLVNVFRKLKVDVATLANNHILDYGEQGVFETISFCESKLLPLIITLVILNMGVFKTIYPIIMRNNIKSSVMYFTFFNFDSPHI